VDLYALNARFPADAETLEATLDYLLHGIGNGGSAFSFAQSSSVAWNLVLLYPKDTKSDDVKFSAKLRIPVGWKFATALPVAKESSEGIEFETSR